MGKGGLSSGAREVFRIILWMCYVTQLLISSVYVLLDCITFADIWQASGQALTKDVLMNQTWRSPLASCLLSALLVLSFNVLTCIILIKKSINRSGPGFGYGFVLAYCFTLAFFCLLCSLVLDGFKGKAQSLEFNSTITSWTSSTTQVYVGTEVLGFVCTGVFLLFSLILLVFQHAVADQLGIAEDMQNEYAGLPEVPALFVPPPFKSDTPGFTEDPEEQQQQQYGSSTRTPDYAPPGYGQPAPGYTQPGVASYQATSQQYTTYNNQGYESEQQGLTSGQPNSSYRATGTTF